MSQIKPPRIVPHLWYTKEAEEAARFYASVFPDSRVDRVVELPVNSPGGAGSLSIVELTLCGQAFMAISAGPHDAFNDAVSFLVQCDSQAEIDRYWNAILEAGGRPTACGWITDRYGLRWQIVPAALVGMLADRDPEKARRVSEEMLTQVKLDLGKLQAAYDGA